MPKAYIIFQETITDPAGMKPYAEAAMKAPRTSTPLAFDSAATVLEGEWPANQTVILEFESAEAAQAWYDSPEYQAAKELRQKAATTNIAIVHGF